MPGEPGGPPRLADFDAGANFHGVRVGFRDGDGRADLLAADRGAAGPTGVYLAPNLAARPAPVPDGEFDPATGGLARR